jgi:hypothetical protein
MQGDNGITGLSPICRLAFLSCRNLKAWFRYLTQSKLSLGHNESIYAIASSVELISGILQNVASIQFRDIFMPNYGQIRARLQNTTRLSIPISSQIQWRNSPLV